MRIYSDPLKDMARRSPLKGRRPKRVERKCACGCGLYFQVIPSSKRIYYNMNHSAKDRQRRFRDEFPAYLKTYRVPYRKRHGKRSSD